MLNHSHFTCLSYNCGACKFLCIDLNYWCAFKYSKICQNKIIQIGLCLSFGPHKVLLQDGRMEFYSYPFNPNLSWEVLCQKQSWMSNICVTFQANWNQKFKYLLFNWIQEKIPRPVKRNEDVISYSGLIYFFVVDLLFCCIKSF